MSVDIELAFLYMLGINVLNNVAGSGVGWGGVRISPFHWNRITDRGLLAQLMYYYEQQLCKGRED